MVKALLINITYQYIVLMGRKRKIHCLKVVLYSIILFLCLYNFVLDCFDIYTKRKFSFRTHRDEVKHYEPLFGVTKNDINYIVIRLPDRLRVSISVRESYHSVREISISLL